MSIHALTERSSLPDSWHKRGLGHLFRYYRTCKHTSTILLGDGFTLQLAFQEWIILNPVCIMVCKLILSRSSSLLAAWFWQSAWWCHFLNDVITCSHGLHKDLHFWSRYRICQQGQWSSNASKQSSDPCQADRINKEQDRVNLMELCLLTKWILSKVYPVHSFWAFVHNVTS